MASISSFFNSYFISLFLLLVHLGCFIFTSNKDLNHPPHSNKKRKPHKALSSSWSFMKRIFSSYNSKPSTPPTLSSERSSQRPLVTLVSPETNYSPKKQSKSDISSGNPSFPLRNDIFPCPICGEIFRKPVQLEHHQSVKHAVTELFDGETGKNIVKIIFQTGWNVKVKDPVITRILKIHNSPKILTRFEEYREIVKAKAARNGVVRRINERCIADGNELLRFHCTTFLCELGRNGNSSLCNLQYCSLCGIIRSGFSPKMDGISTLSSSWRAHVSIPDDIEEEFAFMNVKRAMLVCRVVAGRIGCDPVDEVVDKEDGGYDSVVGRANGSGIFTRVDEDELLVFNPRAVLPCFVIVYTV